MRSPHTRVGLALSRRPKLVIAALTAVALLTFGALRVADLWTWRAQTLSAAESRAGNLSFILSQYIREAFASADASLRQLAIHSRRLGGPRGPNAEWTAILTAARAGLPGLGSLSVTDANGTIVHSTIPRLVGVSRRDQSIFGRLSTITSDELVVGTPLLTLTEPRQYIIPLGRRLTRADGALEGTIVATFRPGEPRSFFRTVDVGGNGIVWVFHPDGIVLFREPSVANPIGEQATGNPIFDAARSRGAPGALQGKIRPGESDFLSAFHPLSAPPLIVAVSLSRPEILAPWSRELAASVAFFIVIGLTMAATLFVLFRQIDAKARAEEALGRAQLLEAVRLREANERLASALTSEQRARRDAEAASHLKDEFLMTVSHELRTPLTAIYGWARMLANPRLSDVQNREAIDAIERNARTQTRLIDDLLDVSRAITGKFRLDVRAVNIREVLAAAVDTIRPAAAAKEIQLETVVESDPGPIAGDPERLQQIVWNLLSNAIKFTPGGGRVMLRLARVDSHAEITVSDTGAGISPPFLPYVFERFRQEDGGTRRRYGGLGLGLAIVRHLVELHGGSVKAESDGEGRGATFRVRLPVSAAPRTAGVEGAPAPVQASPAFAAAGEGKSGGRLDGVCVLLVDDERETLDLFTIVLEEAGAVVTAAESAEEALLILGETRQDVLLSDIEMPGEDGYQLVRKAVALPRASGVPLVAIAVTAYARFEDERRSLEAGFQAHLTKPIEPSDLIHRIASLMDMRA